MAWDPHERRRASDQRNADNAARLAFADFHFKVTSGHDLYQFPKVGDFGLTFPRRPTVSTGVFLDIDDLMELEGVEDEAELVVPSITPLVTAWDQDERDYYTGAWCAVNIIWPVGATVPEGWVCYVDYVFSEVAIKDVDPQVRE